MIIKNVIVYTEDKKFTAGGIVVHDDKIESIYTTENVPDMLGEEVIDGFVWKLNIMRYEKK